jgi:hypothetical protein
VHSLFARYFWALICFGFVAVWVNAGIASAFFCLLSSAAVYFGLGVSRRRRIDTFTERFADGSQTLRARAAREPREHGPRRSDLVAAADR